VRHEDKELKGDDRTYNRALDEVLALLVAHSPVREETGRERCIKCDRPMEYVMTCPMCGGHDANVLFLSPTREEWFAGDPTGGLSNLPAPLAKRYRCRGCGEKVDPDSIHNGTHNVPYNSFQPGGWCGPVVEEEKA